MPNYKFSPITDPETCAECGSTDGIELHHPIPVSMGGKCVIPLCNECHGKAHGMKRKNISELTKKGLARARKKGQRLGRPTFGFTSINGKMIPNEDYEELEKMIMLSNEGYKQEDIAKIFGISQPSVSLRLRHWKKRKKLITVEKLREFANQQKTPQKISQIYIVANMAGEKDETNKRKTKADHQGRTSLDERESRRQDRHNQCKQAL